MKLSKEQKKTISDVWRRLMKRKTIQVEIVHDEIPREMLSDTQLKDPKVAEQIKKDGKYRNKTKIPDKEITALNNLTDLGYVKKTNGKIYRVYLNYNAKPYLPLVFPDGYLRINEHIQVSHKLFDFEEKKYKLFYKTAQEFKNEIQSGVHSHITVINFGTNFSYKTEIFEVVDDFFDAIELSVTKSGKLTGRFMEPFIESRNSRKERKNWKMLQKKFSERRFLKGSKELLKDVKNLSWKKEFIGYIEGFDKRIWDIQKQTSIKKPETSKEVSQESSFGKGLYSYENVLARIFEDAISEYLRSYEHYNTTTRLVPNYLEKEIDIFGERGSRKNREVVICECKLKRNNTKITKDELDYFLTKSTEIKKNESKTGVTSFNFWFVTTTKNIEPDARKFLKKTKIQFMVAKLPSNWERRADWKVTKISEM